MSRTKVLWESQSRLQATFHFENMPNFNYARRSSTGTNFKPCNRSPSQAWELISFPDILNLGTRLAWKSVCRKTQDTTTSRHSTHISSFLNVEGGNRRVKYGIVSRSIPSVRAWKCQGIKTDLSAVSDRVKVSEYACMENSNAAT